MSRAARYILYFACIILLILTTNLLDAYYYPHFTEIETEVFIMEIYSHCISSTARTGISKCLITEHVEQLHDTDSSVQASGSTARLFKYTHMYTSHIPTTHIFISGRNN